MVTKMTDRVPDREVLGIVIGDVVIQVVDVAVPGSLSDLSHKLIAPVARPRTRPISGVECLHSALVITTGLSHVVMMIPETSWTTAQNT
jgi:hypothetical protein